MKKWFTLFILFLSISTASAVELMKWERIPLQISLSVGHERIIFVNKNIRVGIPAELQDKLRVQSSGGVVYLQPKAEFSKTRIQLQSIENGELILLDIRAQEGKEKSVLEPIKIVYNDDVFHSEKPVDSVLKSQKKNISADLKKTDKHSAPLPVLLTRYAAQNLYAPLRTVEPVKGIHPISHSLPATITTLLPLEYVTITPLAAWSLGEYRVVALKISNRSANRVTLDPRHLRGYFYSATFQHDWLGFAGTPEDTTTLYLVIKGRIGKAFLPEAQIKARNKKR